MSATIKGAAVLALVALQTLSGCSSDATGDVPVEDTGTAVDSAIEDTGSAIDSAIEDTGEEDTGSEDTGTADSGTADSGTDAAADSATDSTTDAISDVAVDTSPDVAVDASPDVVVDASDSAIADSATDAADSATPAKAWWTSCTKTTTCAAPSGETGSCATTYGQPVCTHTCSAQADWSICEGGAGICVPTGGGVKMCTKKCGDGEKATCGAGASCANVGYRTSGTPAATHAVGVCVPDCTAVGADTCAGAGTSCDTDRRVCSDIGCPAGCPTGSSCSGSACLPTSPIALYGTCKLQAAGVSNGCSSGLCFALPSPEDGYCGTFCNSESGDTTCGAGGVCWFDNNEITPAEAGDAGLLGGPLGNFALSGGRNAGACLKACTDTADCKKGFFCGNANGKRACIPGGLERATTSAAGTGTAGTVCRLSSECASGVCTGIAGYEDGICTKAAAAVCPPKTVVAGAGSNVCLPTCTGTKNAECRASFVCDDTAGHCALGFCRDNADCEAGYACDKASGECLATARTGSSVGAACTADTTCASNFCIAESVTGGVTKNKGGYCAASCTILPDFTDTCPSGAYCNAGAIGVLGICLDLCDATTKFGACRTGYTCSKFADDPPIGVCVTN